MSGMGTARLDMVPCTPEQLLALIEQPDRFEQLAGLPVDPEMHAFYSSAAVSPQWVAALRKASGPDPWRHGFFLVHHGIRAVIGSAGSAANASTRVLVKCGFRHVGGVVDPEDAPVWRWERSR